MSCEFETTKIHYYYYVLIAAQFRCKFGLDGLVHKMLYMQMRLIITHTNARQTDSIIVCCVCVCNSQRSQSFHKIRNAFSFTGKVTTPIIFLLHCNARHGIQTDGLGHITRNPNPVRLSKRNLWMRWRVKTTNRLAPRLLFRNRTQFYYFFL